MQFVVQLKPKRKGFQACDSRAEDEIESQHNLMDYLL